MKYIIIFCISLVKVNYIVIVNFEWNFFVWLRRGGELEIRMSISIIYLCRLYVGGKNNIDIGVILFKDFVWG